ncbi:hypothetical protein CPT_Moonbeam106 [Bacillus phage Moonbeam]|uniref:Uncharacterized protein n=1 Tax=Bacillus phage Moonbeam TaxID=1540091 RepID=A0A0A0RPI1_9CAUD|nr:hypothetical protein CPT_Moonbeam106 [Bacillus phage Moonbeam]AIW03504.1 hypothetical protein CPT_Moonbeam106 [Bacillus phage Moonbeam]
MRCNNSHCTWHYYGSCCHEDMEEAEKIATPNRLDCPASLRNDFAEQLFKLSDECVELLDQRNMSELIEIKKFIENQRKDDK